MFPRQLSKGLTCGVENEKSNERLETWPRMAGLVHPIFADLLGMDYIR